MNADEMKIGMRVRLVRAVHDDAPSPGKVIAMIPAGMTGVIVKVDPNARDEYGEPYALVKFDQHIATLDEWENELAVWQDNEAPPAAFEPI